MQRVKMPSLLDNGVLRRPSAEIVPVKGMRLGRAEPIDEKDEAKGNGTTKRKNPVKEIQH
jgi:hypothetical protein